MPEAKRQKMIILVFWLHYPLKIQKKGERDLMIKKRLLPIVLFAAIMLLAASLAFSASAAPGGGENPIYVIPPYPAPAGETTTMEYVASYLLQAAGMKASQLGVYPRDHVHMARNVGLFEDVDFVQGAECSFEDYMKMAIKLEPLFMAMNTEPMAPFFYNGVAQPIFDYNEVVRFTVYIESNFDTDEDGKLDLIKAVIQLPKSALQGTKVASVYEAIPYTAGMNSVANAPFMAPEGSTYDLNKLYSTPPARVPAGITTTAEHAPKADPRDWTYYYGANATGNPNCFNNVRDYDYFLVRGFAVVLSAGRGTAQSEGISTCGSDVEIDGYKVVIDWLNGNAKGYTNKTDNIEIKADWSNGNVGMHGTSYGGTTQFGLATTGVQGLKAIIPVAGIASWYEYSYMQGTYNNTSFEYTQMLAYYVDSRYRNNAPFGDTSTTDHQNTIQEMYGRYLRQLRDDQTKSTGDYFDNHWSSRDYTQTDYGYYDWSKIKVPALIVHGTNDRNVRTKQSDLMFQAYKKAGTLAKLIWHQGVHIEPRTLVTGKYQYRELQNRWWSNYLYGTDNGIKDLPTVSVESNVDGSWYYYDNWEAANADIFKHADPAAKPFTEINSYYSGHSPAITTSNFRNYFLAGETPHSTIISKKMTESYTIKGSMEINIRAAVDNLILSPEDFIAPPPENYPDPGEFDIYLKDGGLDWDAIEKGLEAGDIFHGDVMMLLRDFTPRQVDANPPPETEAATAISRGDNLVMSAMLVEVSDTPFSTYSSSSTAYDTLETGGIWFGGGLNNANLQKIRQVAATQNTLNGKYYKEFAYGWMDLANPEAKYDSYTAHRDLRVDLEPGKFYDYTLYLQPTVHTVKAGNELALVIFAFYPGQGAGQPTTAQGQYTITIDNEKTFGRFPNDPVNTVTFLGVDGTTVLSTQYIPDKNYIDLAKVPVVADIPSHTVAGWTIKGQNTLFDLSIAIDKDYTLMPLLVERPTIEVLNVVTVPGGAIDVTYTYKNNYVGFTTLDLELPYDRSVFWPTAIVPGGIILAHGTDGAFAANPSFGGADIAKIAFASNNKVTGDGLLFTVTYQVAAFTTAVEAALDVNIIKATVLTSLDVYQDLTIYAKNGTMIIGRLGDINGDGLVTPEDAMLLLQMIVGLVPWTERALRFGDINGDGIVDTSDATLILRMVVG